MTKLTVGPFIAGQKTLPAQVRDREAFLQRARTRDEVPSVAGLPLVGLGGSCGKPAFALPYLIRWNDENTRALEDIACEFDCFVEYGAYPHLKLNDGGQEVAAGRIGVPSHWCSCVPATSTHRSSSNVSPGPSHRQPPPPTDTAGAVGR